MFLDLFIVISYLAAVLLMGVLSSGKIKSVKDFSLSDTKYAFPALLATLSASFIGGGFSAGNAAKTVQYGIGNILALFGFSVSVILVGAFIVPRIRRLSGCLSVGDIMGSTYGGGAKLFTGIFSFLVCAGILGAQVGAMGYMFQIMLGTSPLMGIIIGCSVIIVYSTFGGMKAVVASDILQVVVLGVGVPLLLYFSLQKVGGLPSLLNTLPPEFLNPLNGSSLFEFISLFLTLALGEALVPPFVQRLMMGKSLHTTRRATIFSGVLSVPFFIITGAVGLAGAVYFCGQSINPESVMPLMVSRVVPTGFRGLIIAAMLAVLMSSSDSYLNSASVALVNDVIVPLTKDRLSQSARLSAVHITSLITGVFAIVTAAMIPNVLDVLTFAYSFWSPVILVPLAAALMGTKKRPCAFYFSAFSGLASMLMWNFALSAPLGIDGTVVGVIVNFMVFMSF